MKMNLEEIDSHLDCVARYREHNARWAELCHRYLPVASGESIWKYSRRRTGSDPQQGWKLHLSATVINACDVLSAVGPALRRRNILFKAPASLRELDRINAGIHYGYSQVGKFITVYPETDAEGVALARLLHRLTRGVRAPSVPFDIRYRPESCVYYRYGSFTPLEMVASGGARVLAVRDPSGRLVPDEREGDAAPVWVADPFAPKRAGRKAEPPETKLKTTFKAFRALTQRGKGGVYLAVDLSVSPPRLCVLKEGRRDGETNWDGRDGYWRVAHEARVLAELRGAGVPVPHVYSPFKAEKNFFVAMEYVEGESLHGILKGRRRRLPTRQALALGLGLAELVARVHAAGWVWRDCKPSNVILTAGGELRPLDFEGACPVERPDPLPWGTPSFVPPEWYGAPCARPRLPEDLYALGATLYLMLVGRAPAVASPLAVGRARRGVHREVCRLIEGLLDPNPDQRPSAAAVALGLKRVLSETRDTGAEPAGPQAARGARARRRGRESVDR
jgi:hypothetical protein